MIFKFAGFELDTTLHELRRGGVVCAIEPQVFDLLHYLIEHRDRLVAKDELLDAIWTDRTVSDWALSSRIMSARKAVGDDGKTQAVIRTVPRRGFRFVADVEVLQQPQEQVRSAVDGPFTPQDKSPLSDKPSIAVLPFDNMSGDPGQEYFSDGIAEDIITALSRFHQFFVIARSSSFTYNRRAVDVKQVARELGVQYVIEGSVRQSGNRVRITAQLIDAANNHHIWAENYDRELGDIFAVQDEITEHIAMAVAPELDAQEMARAQRKNIQELGVWELLARANWQIWKFSEKDSGESEHLLLKALELDPNNSRVHAWLSRYYLNDGMYGWRRPASRSRELALEMGQKAFDLNKDDELAHTMLGASLFVSKRHKEAIQRLRAAVKLNPNFFLALSNLGSALVFAHEHDEGLEYLNKAMRLSPKDPHRQYHVGTIGLHHFIEERYDESLIWAEKLLYENQSPSFGYLVLAPAHGMLGNLSEAREAYEKLSSITPNMTIAGTLRSIPFAYEDDEMHYAEGLRRAGMPE